MSQKHWSAVDRYIVEKLALADPVLTETLASNEAAGLPQIDVSPPQGKLLHLIARMIGAKRILEIGTLGAYSTIWLAQALPEDGRIVTLEYDPHHARVARANIERAGLSHLVELRVGPALDTLAGVEADGLGPFDLVFIDADKPNNPAYLKWALRLSRPGAVIVCDNVVRDGAIVEARSSDPDVKGVRTFFDMLAAEPRLSATALQTVGAKGWDGFALAVVHGR
ncbi:MAG TPA: O-methyltransferase [Roseiarcus sp.]|nr:O-methyltransferase [Roseiarcus sp.]